VEFVHPPALSDAASWLIMLIDTQFCARQRQDFILTPGGRAREVGRGPRLHVCSYPVQSQQFTMITLLRLEVRLCLAEGPARHFEVWMHTRHASGRRRALQHCLSYIRSSRHIHASLRYSKRRQRQSDTSCGR